MALFVVRRLLWAIPVILLVILMTFLMMRQIEGNPFRHSERNVTPAVQANLERKFNLDKPWYVQYALYVKGVVTFDLGPSLVLRNRDVNDIVKEHFPRVARARVARDALRGRVRDPAGSDIRLTREPIFDYGAMFISNVGFAVPSFLVATLLIYFFALKWGDIFGLPDERLGDLERQDPADDRARPRADGVLRAARSRNDARDAAAGLRANSEGEGAALAPGRGSCTCCGTR